MALGPGAAVLAYVIALSLFVPQAASLKPFIRSKFLESIVAAGEDFEIECEGNGPIKWHIPEQRNDTDEETDTTVSVHSYQPSNKLFEFGLKLKISKITYPYVGYYYCYDATSDYLDDSDSAKIYLFVKDEEHLSVNNVEVDSLIVAQYDEVVIPCRPTSPDVTVTLYELEKGVKCDTCLTFKIPKVIPDIIHEDGTIYRYDVHQGFVTNHTMTVGSILFQCTYEVDRQSQNLTVIMDTTFDPKTGFSFQVNELSDQGQYFCNFSLNGLEKEIRAFYVLVVPVTESIPSPVLEKENSSHGTIVGEKLVLVCSVSTSAHITMEWVTPNGKPDPNRMKVSTMHQSYASNGYQIKLVKLTIKKATLQDRGKYWCNVTDFQNHSSSTSLDVVIFDVGEHFINLTEENEMYTLYALAGDPNPIVWRIDVKSHPVAKLSWVNNQNETIPVGVSKKYQTSFTHNEAILKIKDISIEDFGNYTLTAENRYEIKSLVVTLNVTSQPKVAVESDNFHMVNKPCTIKCTATANPPAQIQWYFQGLNGKDFEPMNETGSELNGLQLVSYITLTALKSGHVKCAAENSLGEDDAELPFYVSDVENGLDIFGFDDTVNYNSEIKDLTIALGDTLKMTCGASVYNYTDSINWYHNSKLLAYDDRYTLERSNTEYTNRIALTVPEVTYKDSGIYTCQIVVRNGDLVFQNVSVAVSDPVAPQVIKTNMLKEMKAKLPGKLELVCEVWGLPKPTIIWFKNNEVFQQTGRVHFENSRQKIVFSNTDQTDEGSYRCQASNKVDRVTRETDLKFTNKPEAPTINKYYLIALGVLIVVVVLSGIYIVIKLRNEKKLQRELQIFGLANFEKGALENLNPDLGIDDQAELLPYDKKWEFPIEKLKLGKQLGSGAFGVVMKGEARGINDDEYSTVVAVKMVKRNADHTYIKALASELKIMVHLGKHINVVNLLGACTKNVVKRELLVIVEYCRFGNLHNYLLRHRDNFIDQVNPKTGSIDYTIGLDVLERTYSSSSNRSNCQSPYLKYAALTFAENSGDGPQVPQDMEDYRGKNYSGGITAKTDTTMVSMTPTSDGENGPVLSNNSIQPEWRSNYRGDYKDNVKPICTKDLLTWAFQVSRGMEYLASRKVLHGDLAARNILLADNNVVKICDFGLAKSMYKNDNYKKKGEGPLPVKWMAIESIRDRIFSTQSDVWSFGIVLWEFFSLARTPYPGMEADERLYNKLLDGYRMETPEYSPKEMYKMMLDCWQPKPNLRPCFTKLAERIGSMLEDSVRKHYIDLNDPYLVMNTQRLEDGHSDYLMMLSPPSFDQLSSPHQYANNPSPLPAEEGDTTPGYLCMKPSSIFSPRAEDTNQVFDFSVPKTEDNRRDKDKEDSGGTELVPMLGASSDSESVCNSPTNSFANPSYHVPPKIVNEKSENNIKFCKDNYINMPQNKMNPFKGEEVDKHYVNSNVRDWESVPV